jgi:prepilin-type N-terminal cleavage/methylation domain-containing protein
MKRTKKEGWYRVSLVGGLVTSIYGMVPPILVYADNIGALTPHARAGAIGGMLLVTVCAGIAKKTGKKLFSRHPDELRSGFTLIELLIVISIIGLLAAIIFPSIRQSVEKAYYARALGEFKSLNTALELYAADHGGNYPADASRGLPAGLETYLSGHNWPNAPWPGTVYDWDSWAPADLSAAPKQQVYQISIRFCSTDIPPVCSIPNESWAQNFDYYSSLYYCVSGPCRAHSSQPINHPGVCVNC